MVTYSTIKKRFKIEVGRTENEGMAHLTHFLVMS